MVNTNCVNPPGQGGPVAVRRQNPFHGRADDSAQSKQTTCAAKTSPPDFLNDLTLTRSERLIGYAINRRVKLGHDLFHSAQTIAGWVGCSKRVVQLAIKTFVQRGWMARISDFDLRTRRRFVLLWRLPNPLAKPVFSGLVSANNDAHSGAEIALTNDIPPHPPIYVSEDKIKDEGDGGTSSSSFPSTYKDQTENSPEDGHALTLAETLFGSGSDTQGRIKTTVKDHGSAWVIKALEVIQETKNPRKRNWNYFFGILRNFRCEGGPSVPRPVPPPAHLIQAGQDRLRKQAEETAQAVENDHTRARWGALLPVEREKYLCRAREQNPSQRRWPLMIEALAIEEMRVSAMNVISPGD